ncbi:hypothetical protein BE17_19760 [Sorangium cellulosum]|uniref:Uncharacterized protein n=1 Tax=Sorangium cellulosum TaxID=56 RepID=A0A150S4G6_SORCE|nr:hypothetical protein BE17_19760 [Sorangium cellulosum]
MTSRSIQVQPIDAEAASAIVESIHEPVVRNLVSVAFGKAWGRFARSSTLDGQEIPLRLPAESFDMAFFIRVTRALFSTPQFIRSILEGEAVPPAPIVRAPLALNEEAAERVRQSISDPVCRNLVTAALNEARRQIVESGVAGKAEAQASPRLPFDMEFFATVMEDYFSLPWLIERLLDGQSPAQASGWDDE